MNNYTKIEIPQNDGITVKERIIQFFLKSNVIDRKNAEMLYDAAERQGLYNGTAAFDASISLICKELALSEDELADGINSQNNTKSN